jgi:hypothetical protein
MGTSSPPETPRPANWYVATLALLVGLPFCYLGTRGLLAYFQGAREAPDDPIAGGIGLIGGSWMILMATRLMFRRERKHQLFNQTELLVASVLALVLGIGVVTEGNIGMHRELLFPAVGVAGLALWWKRRSSRAASPAA